MKSKPHVQWIALLLFITVSFGILNAAVPDAISNPYPANGATNVSTTLPQLSWSHSIGSGGAPLGYKVSMWDVPHSPAGFTFKFEMYGKYYYLSNSKSTWPAAKAACEAAGGYLATSFCTQMNTLLQNNAPTGENVWIGLSDEVTEGTYVWHDGRAYSYTNWSTGEPNNSGNEDYVELYKADGKWNDTGSGSTRYYFLQLSADIINIETTATSFYDLNIELKPNTTYYWKAIPFNVDGDGSSSTYSFTTGNSGTKPVATTVVSPSNGASGVALNPTLSWNSVAGAEYYKLYIWKGRGSPDAYGNTLIGVYNGHAYYKSADATGSVTWETARANCESYGAHLMTINSAEENNIAPGDVSYWIGMHDSVTEGDINWVTGEPINYTNWGDNEPNGDTEDYIHVRSDKKWNDNSGTATMRYLVEYPGTILDGKVITGTSYSFKDVNLEPSSTYCWVVVPYNSYGRPWVSTWWSFTTGGSGSAPGTISEISPANGASNVPINTDLSWTAPSGTPTEYYAYFGTNNTIGNAANYTDLGFWNGRHYYRYNAATLPWCAAEAKAKADGGYLATIGSANENNKLAEASGNIRWFGGYDRMTANCWKFSNGDPWAYTNWWTSQPSGGTQYYTQLNFGASGRWDDDGDGASRYFLLETVPNIADGTKVATNRYTPSLLNFNTTYYWSAVGSNAFGMADDTQRWSFTTGNGKAVNPSPANGATGVTGTAFDWDDVGGASGYLFYLGSSMGNWNLANGEGCPTSGFTYGGTLDPNFMYFWKVATVTPLETVQGNVWNFTTAPLPVFDVLVTSQPSGADISVGSKPPAPITPYTFYLNQGSSATYTVSKTDYTWTLDPVYNSNVVTNIAENKHINFIGTYHHVDSGTGFEYTGSPGVSVSYTATTSGNMGAPLPPNTEGLDTATILIFSGSEPSNLIITVPIGTWYVIAYYNGIWNNGVPYPITGPGTVTFANVPLGSKADVPVIISQLDQTLPVELSSFTAVITTDLCVKIAWVAQSETNHSGYNILRGENDILNSALRLNPTLIDNGIPLGTQMSYSYIDQEAYSNMIYYYWLESISLDGNSEFYGPLTVTIGDPGLEPLPPAIPLATRLLNAFPNPFNPNTNLRYSLKEGGQVQINIYNVKGQLIKSFFAEHASPGYYQLAWDGRDQNGKPVTSGIYMYQMSCGRYHETKKMILAK